MKITNKIITGEGIPSISPKTKDTTIVSFIVMGLTIIFLTLIFGCSKSNNKVDCHSGFSLYTVTSDEIQNLSGAAASYSQDPSPANCENYKNALNKYVDALTKYEKCAFEYGSADDWKEYIREAKEGIKQLQCQ